MNALPTLACALATLALAGCAAPPARDDAARAAALKNTYEQLHARLEKAALGEPLVASAFADRGQVALAIRSGLVEELAGNVARRYLDRVTLDLTGVKAHGSGKLHKKTPFGHIKVGEWNVSIHLGKLVGQLRAGSPRVRLRAPDLIEVDLPVDVEETEGAATLRLDWDSAALANVVCKDFELTRVIRGRVLAQHHRLAGALRLHNTGESLTATPLFPDRRIRLALDLTPRSWAVVEAALRSQDSFGKCGMAMNPEKGLARLKQIAASGITVHLPDRVFRTVRLPARLQTSVKVHRRTVGLMVTAESLRIETAVLWSSASVQVQSPAKP